MDKNSKQPLAVQDPCLNGPGDRSEGPYDSTTKSYLRNTVQWFKPAQTGHAAAAPVTGAADWLIDEAVSPEAALGQLHTQTH
jgi:hypothetical protein